MSAPLHVGPLRVPSPAGLERWFAHQGAPPPFDLARSGAPALTVAAVMRLGGTSAARLLDLPLDYGDGAGHAGLRDAIAASGAARHADDVLVTHGAVEALLLACAAIGVRDRRVLVGTPAYEALTRTPAALGALVEPVGVWRSGEDVLHLDDLLARIEPGVAAVLVNSPANPSGAVARHHDLAAVAARCADVGAVAVVDEVAVRTLDASARSVSAQAWFAGGAAVAVGDVSKQCGLGGLRVGWLTTASPRLLDRAREVRELTSLGNAAPAELLARLALEHREAIVGAVRGAARRNLAALERWVAPRPDAALTAPRDGLVALPFLPRAATTGFAQRLRRDRGVAVVPGSLLGVEGHVRVGLGVAPPEFDEALRRLDAALRSPAG